MDRARLLDLTRSLRRAGRIATGVDRVEQAYLTQFLADDVPFYGLVRTPFGYLLLDRDGIQRFQDRLDGRASWGRTALLSHLVRGRSDDARRAESDLRRFACARARRGRLGDLLKATFPNGFEYYNVGHSNLTNRVLASVKAANGFVHVLVHDVIPLDYPQFQRDGTVEPFRQKMRCVGQYADRVIYNSQYTKRQTEAYFKDWGPLPDSIVAHLGIIDPVPDARKLPANLPPAVPYFVVVGTIEPRKNHAFLLDIWEELGPDAPPLLICGSRGWKNEDVFARLDRLPSNSSVQEVNGLSDGALAALVQNSAGTLFPSVAEGFGLPPIEALALGARVLCNNLEVLGEFLGKKAIYAPVTERYLWIKTIKRWAKEPPVVQDMENYPGPEWVDHFKTVLRLR